MKTLMENILVRDAFTEICNVGTGKAASAMSEMLGRRIEIAVPSMEYYTGEQGSTIKDLEELLTVEVSQAFRGDISGQAFLLLSKEGSLRLGKLLLGELESEDAFGDSEQGAILEMGNIMIGALMGSLSNVLSFRLQYGLPQIHLKGSGPLDLLKQETDHCIIIVRARLHIDEEDVQSYLVLTFSGENFSHLVDTIVRLVEE